MERPTFNMSLEDAEFVVEELPYNDLFTRELRAWIDEQHAEQARLTERAERFDCEVWFPFLWSVVSHR